MFEVDSKDNPRVVTHSRSGIQFYIWPGLHDVDEGMWSSEGTAVREGKTYKRADLVAMAETFLRSRNIYKV